MTADGSVSPPHDLTSYYARVAPDFDRLRLDGEVEIGVTSAIVLGSAPQPGRVLDVGCGTGRYGQALRVPGSQVIGVDRSQAQLSNCHGLDAIVCASAGALPFADRSFAVCSMILMLHQVPTDEYAEVIGECGRVLVPDGLLAIKTCSEGDIRARWVESYFPSALRINLARYPAITDVRNLLEDEGFEIEGVIPTRTETVISTSELIAALEARHNTTLQLLSPQEVEGGVAKLRAALTNTEVVVVPQAHTHLLARRRIRSMATTGARRKVMEV